MQDFMQNSGNRKLSQKYNNLNGKKYMLPVAFALNHEILIVKDGGKEVILNKTGY